MVHLCFCLFFFFQAEDGIRDHCVTGVQTCALPICLCWNPRCALSGPCTCLSTSERATRVPAEAESDSCPRSSATTQTEIGRASCRERGVEHGGDRNRKQKTSADIASTV